MIRTRLSTLLAASALVAAALATFHPSLDGDFIWDDRAYLLSQPEVRQISWSSLVWAFSLDAAVAGHYHPLTWLSWMLDFAIAGGPNPRVFHATNLALHALHGVLLFCLFRSLLRRMGLNTPDWIIVAALLPYLVHPLRVESVAWITERRDLLSGVLYAATLLFYVSTSELGYLRRRMLLTSLLFLACGLSKAWAVSLLPVMWVIDRYALGHLPPLNNWGAQRDWLHARWLLCVGTVVFVVAGLVAAGRSGAMVGLAEISAMDRLQHAAFAWWYYPIKSLWPMPVAPYYGWAGFATGTVSAWSAVASLVMVWALAVRIRVLHPWLLALLLAYTAIILPVLGLVQSGPQLVADRYTYIAMVPFHFVLAAFLTTLLAQRRHAAIAVMSGGIALASGVLALLAFQLNDVFKSEMAFWTRVIEVSPDDVTARHNRAKLAWRSGFSALAVADLRAAVHSSPDSAPALMTLVDAHLALGQLDDAEVLAAEAISRGLSVQGYMVQAKVARARGNGPAEVSALRQAVELAPTDASILLELSRALAATGAPGESLGLLERASLQLPHDPDLRAEMAVQLAAVGRAEEALGQLDAALAMAPREWALRGQAEAWRAQIAASLRAQQKPL